MGEVDVEVVQVITEGGVNARVKVTLWTMAAADVTAKADFKINKRSASLIIWTPCISDHHAECGHRNRN